jgi:hypothetical protein
MVRAGSGRQRGGDDDAGVTVPSGGVRPVREARRDVETDPRGVLREIAGHGPLVRHGALPDRVVKRPRTARRPVDLESPSTSTGLTHCRDDRS